MVTSAPKSRALRLMSIGLVVALLSGCASQAGQSSGGQPGAGAENPVEIRLTQHDGSEVVLDFVPQSICVQSYPLAMILFELGVENITSIADSTMPYPDGLAELPKAGTVRAPDFEMILLYETDLVISSNVYQANTEEFLREQGIASCYLGISTYSDTRTNIEILGRAFGRLDEMERLLDDIDRREQAVLELVGPPSGRTVAILWGTGSAFMFNTEHSYVGEMAAMLGLENVVKPEDGLVDTGSIDFSDEQLVALDPDIIIRYAHSNWEGVNDSFEQTFRDNNAFANMRAVRNGDVYDLDPELFMANTGTRAIVSFETLAQVVFGVEIE